MEPEGSLPGSQESTTGPYSESDESSPYRYITFSLDLSIYLSRPRSPLFATKFCGLLSSLSPLLQAQPISSP
jgi:hypothetical protein